MNSFLSIKGDQIIFNGAYMEAYIPKSMFTKGICQFTGANKLTIFGLFVFKLGNSKGEIEKGSKLQTFNFPSIVITKPSSSENRTIELVPGKGEEEYVVLKYFKDDALLFSRNIISKIENIEIFINLLIEGKLPHTLSYNDLLRVTLKCMEVNGGMDVQAVLFSVVILSLYRSDKDLSVPFRKLIGAGKAGPYEYKAANARTVCANDSTFSAMIFEDIDSMTMSSVNRKRYNRQSNETPLEQLIK